MVWMCVQRDVVQDKFMLTSSQAVKWQSSKRVDCNALLFTTSLTGPWLISAVKTITQRIPPCKVLQVNVTTCMYQSECINSSTGDSSLCLISWSWCYQIWSAGLSFPDVGIWHGVGTIFQLPPSWCSRSPGWEMFWWGEPGMVPCKHAQTNKNLPKVNSYRTVKFLNLLFSSVSTYKTFIYIV